MEYPIDLTKKWVLYNTQTKEIEKENIDWPRPDGMEVIGLDKKYRYLEYVKVEMPEPIIGYKFIRRNKLDLTSNRYVVGWEKVVDQKTPKEIFEEKVREGYKVEPEGFILGLNEDDQNAFTRLLTLLSVSQAPDSMKTQISDKNGQIWSVTVGRLKEILVSYGLYYQSIWAASKQS